jgi:hypothetical protein
MGRTSKGTNKYAAPAQKVSFAGPSLCIDTIADPEGLQRHINRLLEPSKRLSWEEFKEKHKDQLEDRMGQGIERETKKHREMLDEERRNKLARGVNHERDGAGKKGKKDKKSKKDKKERGRRGGSDEEAADGKPVRLSDFQKGGYADTSDSDASRGPSRESSPTPAWLLPMSEQEADQKRAAAAAAAQTAAQAQGQQVAPECTLLAIRILTRKTPTGGEGGSVKENETDDGPSRKRSRWSDYRPEDTDGMQAEGEAGSLGDSEGVVRSSVMSAVAAATRAGTSVNLYNISIRRSQYA